jgi:hypothetical protein
MGSILSPFTTISPRKPHAFIKHKQTNGGSPVKIYRASPDYIGGDYIGYIGDASLTLTALQQLALWTKSVCLPLLADNPFNKGQNEDAEIDQICLEDLKLPAIPRRNVDAKARRTFDNLTVQ